MITGASTFPYIFTLWVWLGGSIILPIVFYVLVHLQKRKQKENLDVGDWFFMIALTIFILLWGLLLPIEITLQTPGPHPQYSYSMNWLNLGILVSAGIIVILGSVILKKKQKK
jgi:heme/copper-type cytochrome/quinol oxidase subunit 3